MKNTLLVIMALFGWAASAQAQAELVTFTSNNTLINNTVSGGNSDCAVDMNGDYLDDIVRYQTTGLHIDFQNPDGTFTYQFFPVAFNNQPSWSICAGDLDNNGYNDLLFGGGNRVSFVMANADGTEYSEYGDNEYIFSQRSTMQDIDLDGMLDAFVCHDVDLSHPYRNDGTGYLTEDQTLIHTVDLPGNYAAIWVDYNNDGFSDLYITKCRGGASPGDPARTNGLYRNNGDGTFSEVGEEANMADNAQAWSTVFEDFDNDGDFDAFTVNHDFQNRFMINNGDGTFTDSIAMTGIDPNDLGAWENDAADFNNDGFVDIFSELNRELYLNNGDLTFTGIDLDFDEGGIGDFNNDGFLDVVRGNTVHLNDGNDNNWIKINTEGIISNKNGIGSRVELYGEWGMQIREVRSGRSFAPMGSLCTHFGIGAATAIDSLVVKWPSGTRTVVENPAINTMHTVLEASCLLDPSEVIVNGETSICPGDTVELSAPGGFNNIEWSIGGANPTIQVTEAGAYRFIGYNEEGCVSISNTVTISYHIDETPSIMAMGDEVFCAGSSVILSTTSDNNPVWSNGMTGQTIEVTETGDYTVAIDARCSDEPMMSEDVVSVLVLHADTPEVESVAVDSGTAMMSVTGEGVVWLDADGNVLSNGNNFTATDLTTDTTFYVEAHQEFGGGIQEGGKLTTDGGGGATSTGGFNYFDVYEPFTIRTVDVMVLEEDGPGMRTIMLYNADEDVLASTTVDLVEGLQTITLDFEVPVGEGFTLRCQEENLFRNNGGVTYPYPIGNLGQITNSRYGLQYYYYFYNWQVEGESITCTSDLVPVHVTVVDVESLVEVEDMSVFPNPTTDKLNLQLNMLEDVELTLVLSNALGQTVYTEVLGKAGLGQRTHTLDVSKLPAGAYELQLRNNAKVASVKVIVE